MKNELIIVEKEKDEQRYLEMKLIKSNNKPTSFAETWRDLNQIKRKLGLQPSAALVSLQQKDNPQKPSTIHTVGRKGRISVLSVEV